MPLTPLSGAGDLVYTQLERIRDLLCAQWPAQLYATSTAAHKANCIVIHDSIHLETLWPSLYIEIFDDHGVLYRDSPGGNAFQNWEVGIAIREGFLCDEPKKYISAVENMRQTALAIRNYLHLYADIPYFPDVLKIVSQSAVTEGKAREDYMTEFVIEQRYEVWSRETYTGIKSLLS